MTRQEAIEILKRQQDKALERHLDWERVGKAYDLAIEALKAQEKPLRSDLIQRKDVLDLAKDGKIISNTNYEKVVAHINNIPSADYILLGTFHQVRWERDTALKTLEEHGIGFGQKAESATTTDCISRQDAIDAMCRECSHSIIGEWCMEDCTEVAILKNLPPVTPTERTGEWIETESDEPCWYRCSECARRTDEASEYCPNCGAKMGGDTE